MPGVLPPPGSVGSGGTSSSPSTPHATFALGGVAPSAVVVDPDQEERRGLLLASLLLERSRHRDALAVLQPLVAARPGCAQLLCLQGRCLAAIGSRPQVRGVWSV